MFTALSSCVLADTGEQLTLAGAMTSHATFVRRYRAAALAGEIERAQFYRASQNRLERAIRAHVEG